VTLNAHLLKLASTENVLTLALWKDVESMPSALPKIIEQCALVHQAIALILIHTLDANNMSVSQIQNAPLPLHAKMKSVWILANVQDLLTVLPETIEAFVPVKQVTQEIHMELHALQVRYFYQCCCLSKISIQFLEHSLIYVYYLFSP